MIRDFNVEWKEVKDFVSVQKWNSWLTNATGPVGADASAVILAEAGTSGFAGLQVNAADDAGNLLYDLQEVDITKQMRFRVIWTQSSTTATDSVDWIITYTPIVLGTTVLIDPATALSTAVTAADLSSGTANILQGSPFGILNRNTIPSTAEYLALKVQAHAIGTFSADEVYILGLEVRYTPRRTAGPRRNILGGRRLLTAYPGGVQLHASQEGL